MHRALAVGAFCILANVCAAADGEWPLPSGTSDAVRFSPLDEINSSNASRLAPAFTFNTGQTHGEESATLMVGNTLYFVTPFPNILYALDLTKPGATIASVARTLSPASVMVPGDCHGLGTTRRAG